MPPPGGSPWFRDRNYPRPSGNRRRFPACSFCCQTAERQQGRTARCALPNRTGIFTLSLPLGLFAACGGGVDGTTPTARGPASTPPPTPGPAPPPNPSIEITPVGRGIALTSENQILLELVPEDIVLAKALDLAGGAVVFTPAGSGYSREERALDWGDDIGDPVDDQEEIAPAFRSDFTGQKWESFFVNRYGLITFGEPYPFSQHGPNRWGTMAGIAEHLGNPPMIAVLYKPRLGGCLSPLPSRCRPALPRRCQLTRRQLRRSKRLVRTGQSCWLATISTSTTSGTKAPPPTTSNASCGALWMARIRTAGDGDGRTDVPLCTLVLIFLLKAPKVASWSNRARFR